MIVGALLGEGSTDRALLPILRWAVGQNAAIDVRIEWIDSECLSSGRTVKDKVDAALRVQPCDVIFVHRDSDSQPPEWRYREIAEAVGSVPFVAVVPIRMTEVWLLADEGAIRAAAGCVSGRMDLGLPKLSQLENVSDPKSVLRDALVRASGKTGHRAQRFSPAAALYRLADLIEDWSVLRQLSAFCRLEEDIRRVFSQRDPQVPSPAR